MALKLVEMTLALVEVERSLKNAVHRSQAHLFKQHFFENSPRILYNY